MGIPVIRSGSPGGPIKSRFSKMKLCIAEGFPASIIIFLGVCFYVSGTVALTIPTTSPIELLPASNVLPNLFPLLNATSLNAGHYNPSCAPIDDDEAWYSVPAEKKWRYDITCYEALKLFYKEQQRYDAVEFEFLAPEAQRTTQLTTMQTPRRYSFGTPSTFAAEEGVVSSLTSKLKTLGGSGIHWNPSCTVVVAMLNFASPGQLPGQPSGPFQPTDVATFEDLVDAGAGVFEQCVRAHGAGILPDLHFGWVRAGRSWLLVLMELGLVRLSPLIAVLGNREGR